MNAHLSICSIELRELELKLKSASVSKARAEQIAENEAMKLETKVFPFFCGLCHHHLYLNATEVFLSDYSVNVIAAAKKIKVDLASLSSAAPGGRIGPTDEQQVRARSRAAAEAGGEAARGDDAV